MKSLHKVGSCSAEYQKHEKLVPFWQVVLGLLTVNAVALLLFVAVVL